MTGDGVSNQRGVTADRPIQRTGSLGVAPATRLGLPSQRLHQVGDVLGGAGGAGGGAGGVVEQSVLAMRSPAGVPRGQAAAGDSGFRSDVCETRPPPCTGDLS
jgi:hypothetical protein